MRSFRISLLLLVAVGSFASCSDDDDASTDSSAGSTSAADTTGGEPTTTVPPETTPSTLDPSAETTVAEAETTAPPSTTEPVSTYTVVAGDSLSLIGDRSCMTIAELIAANGWKDGIDHVIIPGDVVQITPGACEPVPADPVLPYAPAPARTSTTPECDAVIAAYDAVFGGPPVDATPDAARLLMIDAVALLRDMLQPFGELPDVPAALDALEAGEPEVAAAYVRFMADKTDKGAYDAMQAAVAPIGLQRYVLAVQVATVCPTP